MIHDPNGLSNSKLQANTGNGWSVLLKKIHAVQWFESEIGIHIKSL